MQSLLFRILVLTLFTVLRQKNPIVTEVKYGDDTDTRLAGIHSRIVGINRFLEDAAKVQALKDEMVGLFNQKRALGLINCEKDIVAFSDEPPMLLLALVNHDPDKTKLRGSLDALPPSPHAEVFIAMGCFMGYGLFDQAVVTLEETRSRLEACI